MADENTGGPDRRQTLKPAFRDRLRRIACA